MYVMFFFRRAGVLIYSMYDIWCYYDFCVMVRGGMRSEILGDDP